MRLLTFLVVLIPFLSHAQSQTYVGVVGGGHAASSYIEHTLYTLVLRSGIIPAGHAGIMVKHYNKYNPNLKLNSGIQGGVLYSRKGWKQVFEVHPSLTTTMDYLVLPVDAIIYLGNEKNKLFILIGIFTEFLMDSSSPDPPVPELLFFGEEFYTYSPSRDNTFGYGLNAGLGVQKDFGFGAIHLNGFFNYSISNFIKSERRADAIPDTSNLYNVGVTIGYFIPLN